MQSISVFINITKIFVMPEKTFMKVFKALVKHFKAPQRSVKIKIYVKFFSLFGIGRRRVKLCYLLIHTSNENKLIYSFITQTPEGDIKAFIL